MLQKLSRFETKMTHMWPKQQQKNIWCYIEQLEMFTKNCPIHPPYTSPHSM